MQRNCVLTNADRYMWTEDEIYKNLITIAEKYRIFQCQECADEMRCWLKSYNISGVYIKINAHSSDFIVSERVGGDIAITQNGIHYGIGIQGKVFDNLPNTGIPKQDWLNDFECVGGFEVIEIPF